MSKQTQVIHIEGMTCGGCVKSVQDVVSTLKGVQSIEVSLEEKQGTVSFDDDVVSLSRIVDTIEEAGFDVVIAD
ncbi:heavy-metal-associated domain-containing protein [Psychrobacter sp. I-STPA10]|uniref:heavy-metal-associated domain-containing protein n=1 Tax=Psychrobacter sp. I-STPA10 TaxID=2585769 RepID=UPI001E46F496|nr:cation transporter [Psychrobacter sp. I-STPA10]